jgi:hypothetical protein
MLDAPQNPRDLIELLGRLNENGDIEQLLDQVEWQDVTKRQLYHGILGRLPESAAVAVTPEGFSGRQHAQGALLSGEFQGEIVERVLRAFPDKRRLVFIHVPKCAGTDLIEHLALRYPRLYEDLSKSQWISGPGFFLYLRHIARQLRQTDSIFVSGHVPLNWYLSRQLCRFEDRFFTVVRDPIQIMISQVNYVFKRFFEAPKCREPDTREWAAILGVSIFDRNMPQDEMIALALRALREPRIVPANYICTYLGQETEETALDAIARCNLEITDVTRYNAWLNERWGVPTSGHANKSRPIITLDHLSTDDRHYLEGMCQHDLALHRRVIAELDATGRNSTFGGDLARPAATRSKPQAGEELIARTVDALAATE